MGALSTKEPSEGGGETGNTKALNEGKTAIERNGQCQTECPELTDKQKEIVIAKWKEIECDVAKVGVIMFVRLFENHPGLQETFATFKGVEIEEVRQMKELQTHSLRVMNLLQKVISRLDSKEKMEAVIDDIGVAHFHYGAMPEYIDLVGPQFINAIRPSLSIPWSPETDQAFLTLFAMVAWRMKKAIVEEAKKETQKP